MSQEDYAQNHDLKLNFFANPTLCTHCKDFIWGSGCVGYKCVNCSCKIHGECRIFFKKTKCLAEPLASNDMVLKLELVDWSIRHVSEWLIVINLHKYVDLFQKEQIDGRKLVDLTCEKLNQMLIKDESHCESILDALDELKKRDTQSKDELKRQENKVKHRLQNGCVYKADRHYFLLKTLAKIEKCNLCFKNLYGIIHQGFLCQNCGLLVHRQCSALGLPNCTHSIEARIQFKQYLFGVSLFDLMDSNSQSPELLLKAFETIEKRAHVLDEDLFDLYQFSTHTGKMSILKEQLDKNGIYLTNFDSFEMSMIADLVKTFLRELQDSVIPEEEYERFCNDSLLVKTKTEFQQMVNTINPTHLNCLKTIMKHLIWVWNYQHNQKDYKYFPDQLVFIFRNILLRPLWENVLSSLNKSNLQSAVMRRLFIDYDWGINVPSFIDRPERPPTYKSFENETPSNKLIDFDKQLKKFSWYWSELNLDDVMLLLKDCKEGTFLVSKSSKNSVETHYTLYFITDGSVRSLRIYYDGNFDFNLPCKFESIIDLVQNCQVKQTNGIKLGNGFSKNKFNLERQSSVEEQYTLFRENYMKYETLKKKFDGIQEEIEAINEDLVQKNDHIGSYHKIIELYKNQIDISLNMILPNVKLSIFEENVMKIQLKISELDRKKDELAKDHDYLNRIITQLTSEQNQLKPKLLEHRKKYQNLRMFLKERGEDDEKIIDELKSYEKNTLSELSIEEMIEK